MYIELRDRIDELEKALNKIQLHLLEKDVDVSKSKMKRVLAQLPTFNAGEEVGLGLKDSTESSNIRSLSTEEAELIAQVFHDRAPDGLIIDKDGTFHVDREYPKPKDSLLNRVFPKRKKK